MHDLINMISGHEIKSFTDDDGNPVKQGENGAWKLAGLAVLVIACAPAIVAVRAAALAVGGTIWVGALVRWSKDMQSWNGSLSEIMPLKKIRRDTYLCA